MSGRGQAQGQAANAPAGGAQQPQESAWGKIWGMVQVHNTFFIPRTLLTFFLLYSKLYSFLLLHRSASDLQQALSIFVILPFH